LPEPTAHLHRAIAVSETDAQNCATSGPSGQRFGIASDSLAIVVMALPSRPIHIGRAVVVSPNPKHLVCGPKKNQDWSLAQIATLRPRYYPFEIRLSSKNSRYSPAAKNILALWRAQCSRAVHFDFVSFDHPNPVERLPHHDI
jgi:hypothetical protein